VSGYTKCIDVRNPIDYQQECFRVTNLMSSRQHGGVIFLQHCQDGFGGAKKNAAVKGSVFSWVGAT
jgi:hypothetical protein